MVELLKMMLLQSYITCYIAIMIKKKCFKKCFIIYIIILMVNLCENDQFNNKYCEINHVSNFFIDFHLYIFLIKWKINEEIQND